MYAVCPVCLHAVKDTSAAFAFEGDWLLSSTGLKAGWSSHGCKVTDRKCKWFPKIGRCDQHKNMKSLPSILNDNHERLRDRSILKHRSAGDIHGMKNNFSRQVAKSQHFVFGYEISLWLMELLSRTMNMLQWSIDHQSARPMKGRIIRGVQCTSHWSHDSLFSDTNSLFDPWSCYRVLWREPEMEYRLATVLIKFRTKCRDMSCSSSIGKIYIRFVLATTNSNFLRWSNSFRQAGPH